MILINIAEGVSITCDAEAIPFEMGRTFYCGAIFESTIGSPSSRLCRMSMHDRTQTPETGFSAKPVWSAHLGVVVVVVDVADTILATSKQIDRGKSINAPKAQHFSQWCKRGRAQTHTHSQVSSAHATRVPRSLHSHMNSLEQRTHTYAKNTHARCVVLLCSDSEVSAFGIEQRTETRCSDPRVAIRIVVVVVVIYILMNK